MQFKDKFIFLVLMFGYLSRIIHTNVIEQTILDVFMQKI